jgi:septal ring factor EnvC (AmiA/AmiB activator)
VLLILGFRAYVEARDLGRLVARLERDKALLEEEVSQIERLEQILLRLQRSNDQLRAILGESAGDRAGEAQSATSADAYISSTQRLRWGNVRSVPTRWPVQGTLVRSFAHDFPAVFIATTEKSLVCAGAAGQVVRAGYDVRWGHLVVLDHGNGLRTHYGHNARLLVEQGDHVLKGQAIALSGHSGHAQRSGLYYAVEEDGQFQDPLLYKLWL